MTLILASTSAIRRQLLDSAGVRFDVQAPGIDEAAVKAAMPEKRAEEITRVLAVAKAVAVSRARGPDWVIGSDSAVSVRRRLFDKPRDRGEAAEHLRFFSGRTMELSSSVALACSGDPHWVHAETALLRVRELSDEFIRGYLDAEWPEVGDTVGVFRLEGRGVQLFERIEGDHFTILGMPLIPLLGALRERGLVES